jgi:hypothetical protein
MMTFPLLPRINGIKCVYILSLASWGIIFFYYSTLLEWPLLYGMIYYSRYDDLTLHIIE